jgi:hypothetical protein
MGQKTFGEYKDDANSWITLATGEYYPDILPQACELYKPVLVLFGQILQRSATSKDLLIQISDITEAWMRIQLCRVFRKYVSPETPVEMLKIKGNAKKVCDTFGKGFRNIREVQRGFYKRPIPDEAICAVLWEYKDRGKKGYDLTTKLFSTFRENLPGYDFYGPERAGRDIILSEILPNYPNKNRPVDFIIKKKKGQLLAVGLARYDSDRGGAQEDDRTGGYRDCANEVIAYSDKNKLGLKIIFVNDGPGLLLGSMWRDYDNLEKKWAGQIRVVTLRMINERITQKWLEG